VKYLNILLLLILSQACALPVLSADILVKEGVYMPFFRDKDEPDQKIPALKVDKYPVTNAEYLKFVKSHPEWKKSLRKNIFADEGYLEEWTSDLSFAKQKENFPVTNVSWFAARKYCESLNKRLLTIAEWEYVSQAQDPSILSSILEWYGKTDDRLTPVNKAKKNANGLVGMHGLIWEWVEDFSSAIVAGDSRSSNETSATLFCGSGAMKAKDPSQYATFMRFAYRSSLKARSTGRNLGFRCARNTE